MHNWCVLYPWYFDWRKTNTVLTNTFQYHCNVLNNYTSKKSNWHSEWATGCANKSWLNIQQDKNSFSSLQHPEWLWGLQTAFQQILRARSLKVVTKVRNWSFTSISRAKSTNEWSYVFNYTDMCRWTMGIHSEKCVIRWVRCCANIIECTYTNLDRIAYYTPSLYTAYCS